MSSVARGSNPSIVRPLAAALAVLPALLVAVWPLSSDAGQRIELVFSLLVFGVFISPFLVGLVQRAMGLVAYPETM